MSLYDFWLRKGPSIKYVRNWYGDGGGSYKMRAAVYSGKGYHDALALPLFMFLAEFLSYTALFYLQ